MIIWTAALLVGAILAWFTYSRSRAPRSFAVLALALLRAAVVALLVALAFGAPLSPPVTAPPILAVDASLSMLRARGPDGEQQLREDIKRIVRSSGADQVIVFGDSVREGDLPLVDEIEWHDSKTNLRQVVDRANAIGRSLVLFTDGETNDAIAFNDAQAGSYVVLDSFADTDDAAVVELRVRTTGRAGDTLPVEVHVAAGSSGSAAGDVKLLADGAVVSSIGLTALGANSVTRVAMQLRLPAGKQTALVQAVVETPTDGERRNDTVGTVIEITDRPPVVFVSTSPDLDVREVLRVLRGTLDLPVSAYLRLAPQLWRDEATLSSVAESEVEQRAKRAGMVVVHGDTGWRDVNKVARGARALWSPASPSLPPRPGEVQREQEWYAVPVATGTTALGSGRDHDLVTAALSGLPWDSVTPFRMSGEAQGSFPLLQAQLSRSGNRVAVIAASNKGGVRTVTISGSGFAGWAMRGGRSAELFTALWGTLFDWLAVARGDERAVRPLVESLREGDAIRWRRSTDDSVFAVAIARRGSKSTDTISLLFTEGALETQSSPLPQGVYDVTSAGGSSRLVVNASSELLPAAASLRGDARVAGSVKSDAKRLSDKAWPFVLTLLLLCAEWVSRRYVGLR